MQKRTRPARLPRSRHPTVLDRPPQLVDIAARLVHLARVHEPRYRRQMVALIVAKPRDGRGGGDLVSRALAMLNGQEASPLEAAERAADLTADAKRKAEEDALRRRNAAVLRFWRDAEIFIIPEVPRSSRPPVTGARRWETVSASLPAWGVGRGEENSGRNASPASPSAPDDGPLPWFRPLPSGFAAAWHIVYLGVLPRQRISDIILEKTGSRPELPEEPGLGEGCLAAVVLDMTGMPGP